jgi:hypothetical protein
VDTEEYVSLLRRLYNVAASTLGAARPRSQHNNRAGDATARDDATGRDESDAILVPDSPRIDGDGEWASTLSALPPHAADCRHAGEDPSHMLLGTSTLAGHTHTPHVLADEDPSHMLLGTSTLAGHTHTPHVLADDSRCAACRAIRSWEMKRFAVLESLSQSGVQPWYGAWRVRPDTYEVSLEPATASAVLPVHPPGVDPHCIQARAFLPAGPSKSQRLFSETGFLDQPAPPFERPRDARPSSSPSKRPQSSGTTRSAPAGSLSRPWMLHPPPHSSIVLEPSTLQLTDVPEPSAEWWLERAVRGYPLRKFGSAGGAGRQTRSPEPSAHADGDSASVSVGDNFPLDGVLYSPAAPVVKSYHIDFLSPPRRQRAPLQTGLLVKGDSVGGGIGSWMQRRPSSSSHLTTASSPAAMRRAVETPTPTLALTPQTLAAASGTAAVSPGRSGFDSGRDSHFSRGHGYTVSSRKSEGGTARRTPHSAGRPVQPWTFDDGIPAAATATAAPSDRRMSSASGRCSPTSLRSYGSRRDAPSSGDRSSVASRPANLVRTASSPSLAVAQTTFQLPLPLGSAVRPNFAANCDSWLHAHPAASQLMHLRSPLRAPSLLLPVPDASASSLCAAPAPRQYTGSAGSPGSGRRRATSKASLLPEVVGIAACSPSSGGVQTSPMRPRRRKP